MDLCFVQEIYSNFKYPKEFIKIINLNLLDFDFWYIMDEEQVKMRIMGLKKRYPSRKLIPFARRDDCDDIACFEMGYENKVNVQVIHDFASDGFEQRKEYTCFWEWFKDAIDELIIEGEK